jgi:hypothetical protein
MIRMKLSTIYSITADLPVPERDRRTMIRLALKQRGDVLMALEAARRRHINREAKS